MAPRVEVFTQLSCNSVHGHPYGYNHTDVSIRQLELHSFDPVLSTFHPLNEAENDGDSADPTQPPSKRCLSDPAVQAGAARLQTIMMTTMGFLCAITTGWWGRYGERHGRTRVLAASTLGLMLTYASPLILHKLYPYQSDVGISFSLSCRPDPIRCMAINYSLLRRSLKDFLAVGLLFKRRRLRKFFHMYITENV